MHISNPKSKMHIRRMHRNRTYKKQRRAVYGGHDYLRRCGNREDWEELSEAEKAEDNDALT